MLLSKEAFWIPLCGYFGDRNTVLQLVYSSFIVTRKINIWFNKEEKIIHKRTLCQNNQRFHCYNSFIPPNEVIKKIEMGKKRNIWEPRTIFCISQMSSATLYSVTHIILWGERKIRIQSNILELNLL